MNSTNGKIAEQSKRKLMNALLSVMKQYEFKNITVTQIAQEADLSRKTFYRLFPDKEAVLMLIFEGVFKDCITQIKKKDIHHYWEVVQLYFDYWEKQKELLALLKRNELLPLLFEYSYCHSQEVFECVRSNEIAKHFSRQLPYLLAYAVGGMHSMLIKWVEDDMVIPSTELVEKLKNGFKSEDI